MEQQHKLLYDGDCGVCTRLIETARALDKQSLFALLPYQSFSEAELATYGLSHTDCSRQLQVITRESRVYGGAFGINFFLWQYWPGKFFVALIYLLPILLLGEMAGYALFARYRRHISQWLGLTACALPPKGAVTKAW
jgi:predicted DCC family thiol-disulfide oxidoreductase YuxK